jgi:xanthine dehydrogenase small subunit
MQSSVSFVLDGKVTRVAISPDSRLRPTTTVLQYLHGLPRHTGSKEGCAEGDCGACTVVLAEPTPDGRLSYRAVNACLLFLPMIHGKQIITIENLRSADGRLHPIQQSLVEHYGSQCGFCTPGIVMSLFALMMSTTDPSHEDVVDALVGNLCRCTGYRPIIDAAKVTASGRMGGRATWPDDNVPAMLSNLPHESLLVDDGIQTYFRPQTLTEALEFLRKRPEATIINGATDVALRVTKRHEVIPTILDLGAIPELTRIAESAGELAIGSSVTMSRLLLHPSGRFEALRSMIKTFGSQQIRNLATLGGNIGTASPVGDVAPMLMAYSARVVLESTKRSRFLPIDEFITGYRETARLPDELITSVVLPVPRASSTIKWYKVSRRKDVDIAAISGGFALRLDAIGRVESILLAYGGMADHTQRAIAAEDYLCGRPWTRGVVENALPLIDSQFTPISDVRGSARFRHVAARNLLMKFWLESMSDVGREVSST